jgi:hypothetical protein
VHSPYFRPGQTKKKKKKKKKRKKKKKKKKNDDDEVPTSLAQTDNCRHKVPTPQN